MSSGVLAKAVSALGTTATTPRAAHAAARALASVSAGPSFKLPDLPYDFGALEPAVSGEIMRLHHGKHHAAYVTNLNAALEKHAAAAAAGDVAGMIAAQGAVKFNGGGHVNHSLFWQNLAPAGAGGAMSAPLAAAVAARFGSEAGLKAALAAAGLGVQGSGWAWLGYAPATGRVEVAATANQDPLAPTTGLTPLLGIDVWEHAYYLQYKNVRGDYISALWSVINWNDVSKRYAAAGGK